MRVILTLALMSILLQTVAPVGAQDADPCEGLAPTRLDNQAYAVNAGDLPTALREEPRFDAPVVRVVPPDEVMRLSYRNTCADHARWEFVAWDGDAGWAAEANNWHYWLEPYTLPEPVVVSEVVDGQTQVLSAPLSFEVPADFANLVTMQDRIGTNNREAMRAFPNYTRYVLSRAVEGAEPVIVGTIDVYPALVWARYGTHIENEMRRLRGYMDYQAPLPLTESETGERLPVPDLPAGGAAQIFNAAQQYVDMQNGPGFRFIGHYAQMTGAIPDVLTYRFEGIQEEGYLFISAEFPVRLSSDALPPFDQQAYIADGDSQGPINDYYRAYLDQVSAVIDTLAEVAMTPELAIIDAIFASMSVTLPEPEV